jgi:hypothetical protein
VQCEHRTSTFQGRSHGWSWIREFEIIGVDDVVFISASCFVALASVHGTGGQFFIMVILLVPVLQYLVPGTSTEGRDAQRTSIKTTNMTNDNSKGDEKTSIASSAMQEKDDKDGSPPSTAESSAPTANAPQKSDRSQKVKTNRVSFSHQEDTARDFRPTPKGRRATRSATVGKADPVRDLCIFVAVMAFFTFIALKFDTVGKPKTHDEDLVDNKGALGRFDKMRKAISTVLEKHMDRYPERQDCDLFLFKSTIPTSGFGIFAGKNYTMGEDIVSRWILTNGRVVSLSNCLYFYSCNTTDR